MSPFGKLLADLRRQAKWTQDRLQDRSGVSVSTIRRLETGKPRPIEPRVGTVRALADALATSPHITSEDYRKLLTAFSETAPASAENDAAVNTPAPPRRVPSPAWDSLARPAEELAQVVHNHWREEERQRGVMDPILLPVRWRLADLTDRWDNIGDVALSATAKPLDIVGDLDSIVEVYRRIPSGRLVVLGRAGSGKTVLTLRFVVEYLQTRTADDPVPVIFSLGSWNPMTTRLEDWLADRLVRDYPGYPALAARVRGSSTLPTTLATTLATALVDAGRILPVLDGFDEIAPGLHHAALDALSEAPMPLLVTTRRGTYSKAARTSGVLRRAAGIELTDLMVADLIGYLPRTTRGVPFGEIWNPVADQLRDRPDSPASRNLATVLSTPLMVFLARTLYSGPDSPDPVALLDTTRFPTQHALEVHLLAGFVPTVYRRQVPRRSGTAGRRRFQNRDPKRVQRWLGFLARHVAHHDNQNGGQDLAWWQLGAAVRPSIRILTVFVASVLAIGLPILLVYLPQYVIGSGLAFGVRAGLLNGLLFGLAGGLGFGAIYGLMTVVGEVVVEPTPTQLRLWVRRHGTGRRLVRTATSRFGVGLLGGFVVGLGYGPAITIEHGLLLGLPSHLGPVIETTLINTLVFGLIIGLTAGLAFALISALETPLDIGSTTSPISLLGTNRTNVIRQLALLVPLCALMVAFGGRFVVDLLQKPLGPLIWDVRGGLILGSVGGLGGALAYALGFTAWGQWVLLSRIWLPLTGRLPWATVDFLQDAYHRGVLRQVGAVYQFRHARLQDHLSQAYGAQRPHGDP